MHLDRVDWHQLRARMKQSDLLVGINFLQIRCEFYSSAPAHAQIKERTHVFLGHPHPLSISAWPPSYPSPVPPSTSHRTSCSPSLLDAPHYQSLAEGLDAPTRHYMDPAYPIPAHRCNNRNEQYLPVPQNRTSRPSSKSHTKTMFPIGEQLGG